VPLPTAGIAPALPSGKPAASIDLATDEGAALVKGRWRCSDTRIVETDFRGPGPEGQPTGQPIRTYDYTPHAGGLDFDDSEWEAISASSLQQHRSTGSFNWYRIKLTVAGGFGQEGGSVISGWNAPNRLVIGSNLKPGQTIQLAVFGINGPLSNPPTNFIWVRYAKLDFYKGDRVPAVPLAITPSEVNVEIERKDPAMDAIVGPNPKICKLAEGFKLTEGPVWVRDGKYLLFSDPNNNTIYKYTSDGILSVFRDSERLRRRGHSGVQPARIERPHPTLDPQGRLTINQHGNRRVIRLENDGQIAVLADRYQGKHLNSPNDLVYRSDGTL
jgi:gluconolactonase